MAQKQLPNFKVTYVAKNEKNGKAPLSIRATYNQQSKHYSLGIQVEKAFFDNDKGEVKHKHPNANLYNRIIRAKLIEVEQIYLQQLAKGIPITLNPVVTKDSNELLFQEAANQCFAALKNKATEKYIQRCSNVCSEFVEIIGNQKFKNITIGALNTYEQEMYARKNSANTISRKYKWIKQVANFANTHYNIDIKAFKLFKVAKYTNPLRQYLTIEEIAKIEAIDNSRLLIKLEDKLSLKVSPATLVNIKNAFLIACYTTLRFSDLQNFNYNEKVILNDGSKRIILSTQKTGSIVSIAIDEKIDKWLQQLKPLPSNAICNKTLKIIQKLAGIDKSITFHMSRHSFATNLLNKGARIEVISELLGHTDIRTTKIYAKVANPARDEAVALLHTSPIVTQNQSNQA